MKGEFYERLNKRMRQIPYCSDILLVLSGGATALVISLYIFSIFFLFISRDFRVLLITCPPLAGFILVSWIRSGFNMKRPYEKYDIIPLIEKKTEGNSFPSRHVFSAFVIGGSLIPVSIPLCLIIIFSGALIAVCRVLSGVHFIVDVVFGAAFGSAFSMIFVILYYIKW